MTANKISRFLAAFFVLSLLNGSGKNLRLSIPIDAGISAIISPSPTGCYSASQTVVVTVQNYGNSGISNIPVNIVMTGPANQTLTSTYVPNLPAGSSVNFTVGTVNMSVGGVYTFSASTGVAGDGNPGNDLSVTTRTVSPMINIVAPPAICTGNSATLIASGAASYTWSNGSNSGSIVVSPTVTSTYSIVATDTNGCTSIAIRTISVQNPTITTTNAFGCGNPAYGTLTANAFTPGVISWYSSPVSTVALGTGNNFTLSSAFTTTYYAEANSTNSGSLFTTLAGGNSSFGNMFDVTAVNTITLNGIQMNFNSLTTTTVEVWYRSGTFVGFENSNAGWTQAFTGTVNPLVTGLLTNVPGTFAITVPAGQTYGIYVTTNGGSGVNYTNGAGLGNLFTSNTDLQLFEGKGGSYFSVNNSPRVFNGQLLYAKSCCSSPRVPATFSVVPGITLTTLLSNTAVCQGNSATISVNGAINYTWSPAAGLSPGPYSPSVVVTPSTSTTYSIIGTAPGCTAVGTATAHITVLQGPTLNISPSQTILPGTIITLTVGGAFSYTWVPGYSNNTSILVNPTVTTIYTVTGSSSFGCKDSITTTVVVGNVGLKENYINDEGIKLYPNPGNGSLVIQIEKDQQDYLFEIFDMTGSRLIFIKLNRKENYLDIKEFSDGVYFYKISSVNDKAVHSQGKVIKQ